MPNFIKHNRLNLYNFLINRPSYFYIILSIIIHFIYLFIFNQFHNPNPNTIFFLRGDAIGYIDASENLYIHNQYICDNDVAIRMPGMTFLYYPLRIFFTIESTLSLFVIIQTFFSSISTYLLARIAEMLFQSKKMFFGVFFLYLFSTYVSNYNNFLLTESLAVTTLIIAIYFLLKSINNQQSLLIISGFFITWCVFLRPFMFPIIFCFLLYIIIYRKSNSFKYILYFLFPFLLIESVWISRNYYLSKTIIPFQNAGPYTYDLKNEFIKSFGMDVLYSGEGAWFLNDEDLIRWQTVRPSDAIFSSYMFKNGYTIDSLKFARNCLWQAENEKLSIQKRKEYKGKANSIFINFINSHSYFTTQIYSRVVLFTKFLNQPIGGPLRSITYPFNVIWVFIDSFINYFIILSGFLSLFYFAFRIKRHLSAILLLCLIPAYIFVLFPLYLRFIEGREITLAYPFLTILSVFLFLELFNAFKYKALLFYLLCFSFLAYSSCMKNIVW